MASWKKIITTGHSINDLAVPTDDVAWNDKKITGLAQPDDAGDAANKSYVDSNSGGAARQVNGGTSVDNAMITWIKDGSGNDTQFNAEDQLTYDEANGLQIKAGSTTGLVVGASGSGLQTRLWGDDATRYVDWEDKLFDIRGQTGNTALKVTVGDVDFDGDLDVDGTTNLDAVDIDGDLQVDTDNIAINSGATLTIDNTNATNGVKIGTEVSGGKVFIGHTLSETTVNDNLTVTGDLTVNGTTTTVDTTTLTVTDKSITLAKNDSPSPSNANGAGIDLDTGSTNPTSLQWTNAGNTHTGWRVMSADNSGNMIPVATVQDSTTTGSTAGMVAIGGGLCYNSVDGDLYFYDATT